jgi:DEAD/DEAH box helicase domain-containing protein
MRILTFDIETANWFTETGGSDPALLTIAVVGTHDSATDEYNCYVEAEFPRLWKQIEETDVLVGFNSDHFDIPLLNKYFPGDLTKIKSIDLMKEVYEKLGRRIRLDAIADGTLGKKKSGHGGQSLIWWREGKVDKVKKYCEKDVELTKDLFNYALKNNSLKYKELGKTNEVKLDTSKWLERNTKPMTFTMGF